MISLISRSRSPSGLMSSKLSCYFFTAPVSISSRELCHFETRRVHSQKWSYAIVCLWVWHWLAQLEKGTWFMVSYHFANGIGESIHHLWLEVDWLSSIKKNTREHWSMMISQDQRLIVPRLRVSLSMWFECIFGLRMDLVLFLLHRFGKHVMTVFVAIVSQNRPAHLEYWNLAALIKRESVSIEKAPETSGQLGAWGTVYRLLIC